MDFGKIFPLTNPPVGTDIIIDPADNLSTSPTGFYQTDAAGSACQLIIIGTAGKTVEFTPYTGSVGSTTIDTFTPNPLKITLSGFITFFTVGATLNLNGGEASGSQTGSFSMDYNYEGEASTSSVTCNVNVDIAKYLTVLETQSLSFGTIFMSPSTAAGTVVLGTNGNISNCNGGNYTCSDTPESSERGQFTITGEPSTPISISLIPGLLSGPGVDMVIDTFDTNLGATTNLPPSGTRTLRVGATLHVNNNQTGGLYSGTYTVSVNY